jgi:hypothetical protein
MITTVTSVDKRGGALFELLPLSAVKKSDQDPF